MALFRLVGLLGLAFGLLLLKQISSIAQNDWLSKERTPAAIKAAIQAAPEDWELYEEWSEILPKEAPLALRQAALLNPLHPGIRIELSAAAEAAGDYGGAESNLKSAVALDHTASPRVLLAEFYFRRHNLEQFLQAANSALTIAESPPASLFEDAWALSSNDALILKTAIPDRPNILVRYLQFLLERNHLAAAQPVAMRIVADSGNYVGGLAGGSGLLRDSLLQYSDQLAAHNSAESAVTIWNWLIGRKLLAYEPLAPDAGKWLTNGRFELKPISEGFDWTLSENEGVFVENLTNRGSIRLTFSGKQSEHCEILSQYVPLWPQHRYRLRVRYFMSSLEEASGLTWRLTLPSGVDLLQKQAPGGLASNQAKGTSGSGDREQALSFDGPPTKTIGRLVFGYDRMPGTVRIEGTMEIRGLDAGLE